MKSRSHNMICFPIQIWDFDSSDFSGSNDLRSKRKSKIFNAAYPTQMPSPQKLIPLAGLKHSTHGPCTAATEDENCVSGQASPATIPLSALQHGLLHPCLQPCPDLHSFLPIPFLQVSAHLQSLSMSLLPWEGSNGTSDLPACQGCEKWRRTPLRADTHF